MITIFDIETNPSPFNHKRPPDHPSQPHCVSIASISYLERDGVVDFGAEQHICYATLNPFALGRGAAKQLGLNEETPQTKLKYDEFMRRFTVDNGSKACEINGLTQELVIENGINFAAAAVFLEHIFQKSRWVFSFNKAHDLGMLDVESVYTARRMFDACKGKTHCAMLAAAGLMKMPNKYGYESYAWPKLSEAYTFFNPDQEAADQHHALGDVRTTANLLFHMINGKLWEPDHGLPPQTPSAELEVKSQAPESVDPLEANMKKGLDI